MSVRAWCRRHALREASFYSWRTQLARRDAEALTKAPVSRTGTESTGRKNAVLPPALVPVRVTVDSSASDAFDLSAVNGSLSRIEIVLPNQRCVRLVGRVGRQALTDVLAVLSHEVSPEDSCPRQADANGRSRSASRGAVPC